MAEMVELVMKNKRVQAEKADKNSTASDSAEVSSRKPTAAEKFVVRLPIGMRGLIHTVSKGSRRSMNSEIVTRLEHSLKKYETVSINGDSIFAKEREGDFNLDDNLDESLNRKLKKLSNQQKKALLDFLD